MAHNNMHSKDLLTGAVIGGLLGAVTALLVAPKAGKKIREDLYDACCDFTDKTHEVADNVSKKGRSIASSVSYATSNLTDRARELVDDVKEWVHPCEEECEDTMKDWAVGGLAGVITGVVVGLLLAPKAGSELRQNIVDTYHDVSDRTQEAASKLGRKGKMFVAKKQITSKAEDWLDLARDVVERFTGEAKEMSEDMVKRSKEMLGRHRSKDLMDWASLGLRVWQHLKKRG